MRELSLNPNRIEDYTFGKPPQLLEEKQHKEFISGKINQLRKFLYADRLKILEKEAKRVNSLPRKEFLETFAIMKEVLIQGRFYNEIKYLEGCFRNGKR